MLMRTNYLELQKLHRDLPNDLSEPDAPKPTPAQVNRYDELLAESENHREIDDRIARVFATGLTSRMPTGFEYFNAVFWLTMRFLITTMLYALPVVVGLYSFWNKP